MLALVVSVVTRLVAYVARPLIGLASTGSISAGSTP